MIGNFSKRKSIVLLAVAIFIIAATVFLSGREKACDAEVKICPDGSSVGRAGPGCELASCPLPSGWKEYVDPESGISFGYPETFSAEYISSVDLPPRLVLYDWSFSCSEGRAEMAETSAATINGKEYCVTEESDGAAGSVYTKYSFATAEGEKTAVLTFTARFVQCGNYDEDQMAACEEERSAFDINGLADQIFQTARF